MPKKITTLAISENKKFLIIVNNAKSKTLPQHPPPLPSQKGGGQEEYIERQEN
jgi:hypothetical protein